MDSSPKRSCVFSHIPTDLYKAPILDFVLEKMLLFFSFSVII